MSLETIFSRRLRPKKRGCNCMFLSNTMWKNILLFSSLLLFTSAFITGAELSWADRRKAGEDRLVLLRAGASTERREIYKHERRCLLRRRRLQVLSSVLTYEGLQRSAQSHAGLAPLFFFLKKKYSLFISLNKLFTFH